MKQLTEQDKADFSAIIDRVTENMTQRFGPVVAIGFATGMIQLLTSAELAGEQTTEALRSFADAIDEIVELAEERGY